MMKYRITIEVGDDNCGGSKTICVNNSFEPYENDELSPDFQLASLLAEAVNAVTRDGGAEVSAHLAEMIWNDDNPLIADKPHSEAFCRAASDVTEAYNDEAHRYREILSSAKAKSA